MELYVNKLFNGQEILIQQKIEIQNGLISKIESCDDSHDFKAGILSPGLFDLQINGGGGVQFNHKPNVETLIKIDQAMLGCGTTSWLATIITDDIEVMQKAADAVSKLRATGKTGICGIHFEGPHISDIKKGIHKKQFIRTITEAEMELYSRTDLGIILVTLAPEAVTQQQISQLTKMGICVSLGHSNATEEQCNRAINVGAKMFTHLFNAMSGFESRAPGMVGYALHHDSVPYSFIMDGIHVSKTAANIAFKCNPNMILVSDAMALSGSNENQFNYFDELITKENNSLRDSQNRLAGSLMTLSDAVRNASQILDIALIDAIKMATYMPAQLLRLTHEIGTIQVGNPADFILWGEDNHMLEIWKSGRQVCD